MNKITLAICAYNAEKYIEETLLCIYNQTFQEFDLLIVNDCSTDDTINVVERFFLKNIRQYKIENLIENGGLAAGRNFVEYNVQTKYIIFIDADDCPQPTMIQKLYAKITSDPDLMAVGCYHKFIDSESKPISGGLFLGPKTKKEYYDIASKKMLMFMQPAAIIDREVVQRVGGRNIIGFPNGKPRYQDLCEDLDLWARMSDLYSEGKAIVVVPEVLQFYRKHTNSMSTSNVNMTIRMRHVKQNLLRRRDGLKEIPFVEFLTTISPQEIEVMKADIANNDKLREGVLLFIKGRIFSGTVKLMSAVLKNPAQFWQKFKANSGLFR